MPENIAPPQAHPGTAVERLTARDRLAARPGLLVFIAYLAAAAALTWRLWVGLGTVSVGGDPGSADNDLMAWFMRYAADAVSHGHLPALVSTGLNAPRGFPLMWNNSVLLPAVVLAPVTLLGGPLASLTVLTTLGYAGSAAAMYWLLRRNGASVVAGAIGGAVFGFSPGMVNAGLGHYGMQFAVLTPLMIEAVAAIITGRGSAVLAGTRLGVLAAAQLYIGEEMLVDIAVLGLVLMVVLAASRPRAVPARLSQTAAGLSAAAAVALVLCGYGLWVQFHGPLTEYGTPWNIAIHGNSFGAFVNPQSQLLFHTASSAAYAASHQAIYAEYLAYLGPPLLVVVAGVIIWFWRDLRVRCAGVVWVVLEALSLGVNGTLLPFHWLQGLPVFADMLPSRLSLLATGAAAAVLAFGLDLVRQAQPRTAGPLRRLAPVAVAVLAVLPLVPRPLAAPAGAKVPAGWTTVFTRLQLPPNASVLVVPLPYSQQGEAMLWQADTGQPASLVAGWFLGPNAGGHGDDAWWGPGTIHQTVECVDALWRGAPAESGCATDLSAALRYWHPGAVVADTSPQTPEGRFLIGVLGPPAVRDAALLGWRTG